MKKTFQGKLNNWNNNIGKYFTESQINELIFFLDKLPNVTSILKRFQENSKSDLIKLSDLINVYNLFLKHSIVDKTKKDNILNRLLHDDENISDNALFEAKIGEYLFLKEILIKSEPPLNNKYLEYKVDLNPNSYIEVKSPQRSFYARTNIFKEVLQKRIANETSHRTKVSIVFLKPIDEVSSLKRIIEQIRQINKKKEYGKDIQENDSFTIKVDLIDDVEHQTISHIFNPYLNQGLVNLSRDSKGNLLDLSIPYISKLKFIDNAFGQIKNQVRDSLYAITLFLYLDFMPSEKRDIVSYLENKTYIRKDVPTEIKNIILASPFYADDGFHFNLHGHFINDKCKREINGKLMEAFESLPKAGY